MISSIHVFNYQSLKDINVNLGKVTVIRGKTDTGKSALIRSINSFFSNSLNESYAFQSPKTKEKSYPFGISLVKDGIEVEGKRSQKTVEYIINKKPKEVFSKTNKKVPEEVYSFLGIRPYQVDVDISVFFQVKSQFDTPFLLKESSITVAKILGKITNLNIVMMAMRKMFADKATETQNKNVLEASIKNIYKELKALAFVPKAELMFLDIEKEVSKIDLLEKQVENLKELVTKADSIERRESSLKNKTKKIVGTRK